MHVSLICVGVIQGGAGGGGLPTGEHDIRDIILFFNRLSYISSLCAYNPKRPPKIGHPWTLQDRHQKVENGDGGAPEGEVDPFGPPPDVPTPTTGVHCSHIGYLPGCADPGPG